MSTSLRLLVVLIAALGLVWAGYRWGGHATDNAWRAKEADRIAAAASAAESERRRAEKASGQYQAEALAQRIATDQLEGAFNAYMRQHTLLARPALGNPAPTAAAGAEAARCIEVSAGPDPALSLGAVWMWNSALAGRDVPAGACGLADTSEAACAADAGVTLERAWDNQALNARICAEDRLRHQRLIDHIQGNKQ